MAREAITVEGTIINVQTPEGLQRFLGGPVKVLVVGGTNLYDLPGMENMKEIGIPTPFGDTSDFFAVGKIEGELIAFLPRHGTGHVLSPSKVPYIANAFAAKVLGVERVVLVSACGGMKEGWAPGDFVLFDQLFDFTGSSPQSMFLKGIVAHVGLEGFRCSEQSKVVRRVLREASLTVHDGGKLINIDQFFAGEWASRVFAGIIGAEGIGMTTTREVPPYLEAEMHVLVIGHVTDGNVSVDGDDNVDVAKVLLQGERNIETLMFPLYDIVVWLARMTPDGCGCATRLDTAIQTDPGHFVSKKQKELAPILARYLRDHPKG